MTIFIEVELNYQNIYQKEPYFLIILRNKIGHGVEEFFKSTFLFYYFTNIV